MSKNLQEYLQDNETVLWQGEPAAFPLIENGNKTRVLRTWLLTVVIIGGLLAAYVTKNSQWSMNVAIGMVVIGAVIMISPVFERASVKRQKYYITNQRAILEFDAKTFYSMDLSDIDDYKVVSDVANEDSVVLGSKIFEEVNKQLRWRACHPMIDRQNTTNRTRAEALVFYGVKNAEAAVELLEGRAATRAAEDFQLI